VNDVQLKKNSHLHHHVGSYLNQQRWKAGFLNLKEIQNTLSNLNGDSTHLPIEIFKKFLHNEPINYKIAIFAPPPIIGSGGHRTIYNLARKFIQSGCEVYCFIENYGDGIEVVEDYLGGEPAFIHVGWPSNMIFDLAIATIAHSAQAVSKMKGAKHKAYLVQDFEAWFNPVGDSYTIAENSYTYGLIHFTVGNFLTHVLKTQYCAKGIPAGLGIDTTIYFDKMQKRERAIAFLYQPEKPRRNSLLAINALRIVKQHDPNIKIYVYGSNEPIHLDFEVENKGLIRNLSELNDLYNKCEIGLCISMSNPSRIPYEFMAAGTVPVDLYRYNNLMDYPSGTIKLAYQSAESIAEAIIYLFSDPRELEDRKKAGEEFASCRTLAWETDVFVNNALAILSNSELHQTHVTMSYLDDPIISKIDQRDEVFGFCNWQKKLASQQG
jgi:glycosyltransferase involved in cell wall biosynthesis